MSRNPPRNVAVRNADGFFQAPESPEEGRRSSEFGQRGASLHQGRSRGGPGMARSSSSGAVSEHRSERTMSRKHSPKSPEPLSPDYRDKRAVDMYPSRSSPDLEGHGKSRSNSGLSRSRTTHDAPRSPAPVSPLHERLRSKAPVPIAVTRSSPGLSSPKPRKIERDQIQNSLSTKGRSTRQEETVEDIDYGDMLKNLDDMFKPSPSSSQRPSQTRREPNETRREPIETRREPIEAKREPRKAMDQGNDDVFKLMASELDDAIGGGVGSNQSARRPSHERQQQQPRPRLQSDPSHVPLSPLRTAERKGSVAERKPSLGTGSVPIAVRIGDREEQPLKLPTPRGGQRTNKNLYDTEEATVDVPIDESVIVPDYVRALIQTIKNDRTKTPAESDFFSEEGYDQWCHKMKHSFQRVLSELLYDRYLDPESAAKKKAKMPLEKAPSLTVVEFVFKIVAARGLLSKDGGKPRDAYAVIEYGNIPRDWEDIKKEAAKRDREVFHTEVVPSTNDPVWNQHMRIQAKNLTDSLLVTVYDKRKDEFLGYVRFSFSELINNAVREGVYHKSVSLMPREGKKDKYAGGEVVIEVAMADQESPTLPEANTKNVEYIQSQLIACKVKFKSFYQMLLRNCLLLDMNASAGRIKDTTSELLSPESRNLLRAMGRVWAVGEAYQIIAYLELLFEKHKNYEIPTGSLLSALEAVHEMKKKRDWLSSLEKPILVELLEKMYSHCKSQISKYREFFPKNQPKGALETTIIMMRMIHKNPTYREAHPELPESFGSEMKRIMTECCLQRYETLLEFNAPLDETRADSVIESLQKLADTLSAEIDMDAKYYVKSFTREFDLVKLTAENYIKHFTLTIEDHAAKLASPDAVSAASVAFALYRTLKGMDEKYGAVVPGLRKLSKSAGFNVEKWFLPFINNWLEFLSHKTLEWVNNAMNADQFLPVASNPDDHIPHHSSSIRDLFQVVFSEFEFISSLEWTNLVQRANFYQKFAKIVNVALEQYCDAISVGELKREQQTGAVAWLPQALAGVGTGGDQSGNGGNSKDIAMISCIKLCNLEYGTARLQSLAKTMNVTSLVKSQRDYRAPVRVKATAGNGMEEKISGAFKIEVAWAENIKPCNNKNATSNPYVVVRVPEGTVVPPEQEVTEEQEGVKAVSSKESKTLTGKECEILRTRAIYDTIYATWEETFQCILPPVTQLEVALYSKNLITSDELIGSALIGLEQHTRLRRKLQDHQTHDIYIEIDPQGRLLLRMTMEGDEEDVEFWFKRSSEHLLKVRDDFLRSLVGKISPYSKQVISKCLKDQEAVPVNKGIFASFTAPAEYTTQTATGASIEQPITAIEADEAMAPLTDYLNKNLETICVNLSQNMALEVIKRTWEEILITLELALVCNLYGAIGDRKLLNHRQTSMIGWILKILIDFFHADGQGMGLPMRVLQSKRYSHIHNLLGSYHQSIGTMKRDYEASLRDGREKELVLRLVRLKIEKLETLAVDEREEHRKWFELMLARRKEKSMSVDYRH